MKQIQVHCCCLEDLHDKRLDLALKELCSEYSRNQWQQWIKQKNVWLNGEIAQVRNLLKVGDEIRINVQLLTEALTLAEAIDLDIIFEDEHLVVINKPAGLVVHPGAGISKGTLMNALLFHFRGIGQLPRAGIVHRLDKLTSGLMIIAKTSACYQRLVEMLSQHQVKREYMAICNRVPISSFSVDKPIKRHAVQRTKMAVHHSGRKAVTHFRVLKKFRQHSILQASLETGRTHQIRVHLSDAGYGIIGDSVYSPRVILAKQMQPLMRKTLQQFSRQALHAKMLAFEHPITQEDMKFVQELPLDMKQLIDLLDEDLQQSSD